MSTNRVDRLAQALAVLLQQAKQMLGNNSAQAEPATAFNQEQAELASAAIAAAEQALWDSTSEQGTFRLLVMHGDVEPELRPTQYQTFAAVLAAARSWRAKNGADDGLYYTNTPQDAPVLIEAFMTSSFDEPESEMHKRAAARFVVFSATMATRGRSGTGYWSVEHGWTTRELAEVFDEGQLEELPTEPGVLDISRVTVAVLHEQSCFFMQLMQPDGSRPSYTCWASSAPAACKQAIAAFSPGTIITGVAMIA